MIDAWEVIEAIQLGCTGDLQQVLVAGHILRQQQQVAGFLIQLGIAIGHATCSQVGFNSHDRFDARLGGGIVEFHHSEHGPVVGKRQGWHAHFLGALDHLFYVAESIQQGIFRVDVKVNKGHRMIIATGRNVLGTCVIEPRVPGTRFC